MTRLAALRCAVLSILLLALGLAAPLAATAAPVPPAVTLTASAVGPGSATSTRATVTATIKVAGSPIADAVLTVPVPGAADLAGVTVDGVASPVTTVSGTAGDGRADVTVRLGTGATAIAGGILAVGTHTVAIPTDLAGRAGTVIAPVTVTLGYDVTATASATTTIPLPDLVVTTPAGSGEDRVLPLTEGSLAFFVARIERRGPVVSAATLTITVPRGLTVDDTLGVIVVHEDDTDVPVRCVAGSGGKLTCPVGRVDDSVLVAIPFRSTGTAPLGSTGTFTITATAADGLDATPGDNAVQGTVRFLPTAHLVVRLTADHTRVEVGSKAHVTATVTNVGTYPAPDVLGIIIAANRKPTAKSKKHFAVTDFTGRESDLGDLGDLGGDESVVISARAPRAVRQASDLLASRALAKRAGKNGDDIDLLTWDVGTLAPRAVRKSVLTLKALAPGQSTVAAVAASLQGIDACLLSSADPNRCPETDQLTLRAVASADTNGAGADPIAATGVPTERWAGLALLLLVLGSAAQFAGVRRRTIAGRHQG